MTYTKEEILSRTDHTLLKQDAGKEAYLSLCREGLAKRVASVCVPPRFVRLCASALAGALPVCTVVGFPLGYVTEKTISFETEDALENGASEIDMVLPVGEVKDGNFQAVSNEIRTLKEICGTHILKVIVETCLLTDAEKETLACLVAEAGADFIKTSTGFSTCGATVADVALFHRTCPTLNIKASGGIHTFEEADALLCAGASRIGASALAKLA